MRVISICSPDKISLNMFLQFLRKNVGDSYEVGPLHILMSQESIQAYIDDFLSSNERAIFTYYAKRKVNVDPMKVVPKYLLEASDATIWIDLYGTDYKVLKDECGFDDLFRDSWKKNIEQLEKMGR